MLLRGRMNCLLPGRRNEWANLRATTRELFLIWLKKRIKKISLSPCRARYSDETDRSASSLLCGWLRLSGCVYNLALPPGVSREQSWTCAAKSLFARMKNFSFWKAAPPPGLYFVLQLCLVTGKNWLFKSTERGLWCNPVCFRVGERWGLLIKSPSHDLPWLW